MSGPARTTGGTAVIPGPARPEPMADLVGPLNGPGGLRQGLQGVQAELIWVEEAIRDTAPLGR